MKMISYSPSLIICLGITLVGLLMARVSKAASAPREIYLLIGQSNMAGRGPLLESDKQPIPGIWKWTEAGVWEPASDPLRNDKPKAGGVGPGVSFGQAMAKAHPGVEIGLVNRAFGGTAIAEWKKGAHPHKEPAPDKTMPPLEYALYKDAVEAAKAAMQQGGVLKGILWHQGESDYRNKNFTKEGYVAALTELIANLRAELNASNVPVVLGELGDYLDQTQAPFAPVNEALKEVATKVPKVGVASAQGLVNKGDHLHFDTPSQRLFGQRYAAEMLRLQTQP